MVPYTGDALSRSCQWTELSASEFQRLAVAKTGKHGNWYSRKPVYQGSGRLATTLRSCARLS